MRIRDPGWKKFGSEIRGGKSRIRDREKHPGSATLDCIGVPGPRGGERGGGGGGRQGRPSRPQAESTQGQ
jgi:hypothetical protein